MSEVELLVDDRVHGGWERIRVTRSLEDISGLFELQVSDRWPAQKTRRTIAPGAACSVCIDGSTVITGYVDDVEPSYTGSTRSILVRGRDRTGDLVDCSVEGSQYKNLTLLQLARTVCRPFGIEVSADTDIGAPFKVWQIQQGESVFETLERAARIRGVLLQSDGMGGLQITRSSSQPQGKGLVYGDNILSASGLFSWQDRYSRVTVKGSESGTDAAWGSEVTQKNGVATDAAISRHRPLVVVQEDQGNTADFQRRAAWERNVRAGRGTRVRYTVQGWYGGARLWSPNRMVPVDDPEIGLKVDLLLSEVTFLLDEEGSRSELVVCRPEAFDTIQLPDPDGAEVWAEAS